MKKGYLNGLGARLFGYIGITTAIMVFLLFVVVTIYWKQLTVKHFVENTLSITKTFGIAVKNAIIVQQNNIYTEEDSMAGMLLSFIKEEKGVKYVSIFDSKGGLIISSQYPSTVKLTGKNIPEHPFVTIKKYKKGFVGECFYPLKTGNRYLGLLVVGLDASYVIKDIKMIFFVMLFFTILLTITVLSLIFVITTKLTNSLMLLSDMVNDLDLEKGKMVHFPEFKDEIGFISKRLNDLQQRLAISKEKIILAERKILRAEKLASIGRLASGIAHEINNPINGINHCISLIKQNPEDKKEVMEYLALIEEATNYMENIVKKMLEFSKPSNNKEKANLKKAIESVLSLLEYQITKGGITVELKGEIRDVYVKGDQVSIQEVIMNIVQNSIDSLKRDKKNITISVKSDENTVMVKIMDNGEGIPEENLAKIFDPFFTTKPVGKGTGLGLYVVKGIMNSIGGHIEVESSKNGTSVTLTFQGVINEDIDN